MRHPDDDERMEAHLMNETGHITDIHCWCEPIYYWITDEDGGPVLVVEHDDDNEELSHRAVLDKREVEQDWITRLFNTL